VFGRVRGEIDERNESDVDAEDKSTLKPEVDWGGLS
jgi:hypothetical protein